MRAFDLERSRQLAARELGRQLQTEVAELGTAVSLELATDMSTTNQGRALVELVRGRTVTLVEAATIIGVNPATLRQQIANGKLRATKRGRDWWVTRGEVERYRRDSKR